ncbi:MAG: hypothetical protein ABI053_01550 [Lacisediminihabitans sp.]
MVISRDASLGHPDDNCGGGRGKRGFLGDGGVDRDRRGGSRLRTPCASRGNLLGGILIYRGTFGYRWFNDERPAEADLSNEGLLQRIQLFTAQQGFRA